LGGALGDRQSSVFAVTGNPVPFYFHLDFFGKSIQTTSAIFLCEGFQPMTFFSIRYDALTTSEWRDYMREGTLRQEKIRLRSISV